MAEGGGLENRCTVKCAGGSNPSLSAKIETTNLVLIGLVVFYLTRIVIKITIV